MRRLDNQNKPVPGVGAALLFRGKTLAFQTKRTLIDSIGAELQRHSVNNALKDKNIIAESRTPLWRAHEKSESVLVAGKIHNLRLAVQHLNGVEVPSDSVFSFWKQIGRTSRLRGYVAGRELREGCLIPRIGGGLCQLSNALYDTALRAGLEIVERHPHTQVIPGSLAEMQRDATVFWNYVDLRFKSGHPFRIEARLTADSLVVRFRGQPIRNPKLFGLTIRTISDLEKPDEIENCLACGIQDCFRQVRSQARATDFGRTAYLVDEYWPEFDRYISEKKRESDLLCIPLNGKRYRKSNYAWSADGFDVVKQSRLFTLWRSFHSRKLAAEGAARQASLLTCHKQLAQSYASQLSYDVMHMTLTQNLLPFLWRSGVLGGRTFDVLMTRLPLALLQDRLDAAFNLHPESPTLGDFRADRQLLDAEKEALGQARKIITPHTEMAALYPEKSVLIDWTIPAMESWMKRAADRKARLVFPAATLGRKGVYELREAMMGLDTQLVVMGPLFEDRNFWDGFRVDRLPDGDDWLECATAVVLPSFVEHQPRKLLEAVARGVPVIASTACGLENVSGVTTVRLGDANSLRAEIEKLLTKSLSHTPLLSKKTIQPVVARYSANFRRDRLLHSN